MVLSELLNLAMEVAIKLSPLMVRVNSAESMGMEVLERLVMTGTRLVVTLKIEAADAPPPGAGLVTVMLKSPKVSRSEAGITMVSCVGEM